MEKSNDKLLDSDSRSSDHIPSSDTSTVNPLMPRDFSPTKDDVNNDNGKSFPVKEEKKEDLTQEIELDEHLVSPFEGIKIVAQKMQFSQPKSIEAHLRQGLKQSDVDAILERHHMNELTQKETTHWIIIFIGHLTGFFSLLLWAGAILCFISYWIQPTQTDNLVLGIVLASVVVLTGIFSYMQEAKSAAIMEGFSKMLPPEISVIRDGVERKLEAKYLVPGDVVSLNMGEKVPADFRCCEASNFKCDQSSLTGEPDAMLKKVENEQENPLEASNIAFFGTSVVEGVAKGFIILTGDDTIIGRIAALASDTGDQESPIAKEIHHFIIIISAIAMTLGVVFLIFALMTYTVVDALVFAIGIIVANVPEGLLATVTVSLTLTAKRLAVKQVLVKNLEAVETLGSTTCIASDKTGTLTQNRMTVSNVVINGRIYKAPTTTRAWESEETAKEIVNDETFVRLYEASVLANSSSFDEGKVTTTGKNGKELVIDNLRQDILDRACLNGNATDYAFIKFAEAIPAIASLTSKSEKQGIKALRKVKPGAGKDAEIPFNSAYKFMVSVRTTEESGGSVALMKGASDFVFNRCSTILIDGKQVPIGDEQKAMFASTNRSLGKKGERVIAFAYRVLGDVPAEGWVGANPDDCNYEIGNSFIANGDETDSLCFLGLMSLIDPPRETVPNSVRLCRRAGVKVVMVTGDHPVTAAAIAKTCHIMPDTPVGELIEDSEDKSAEAIMRLHSEAVAIVVPGGEVKEMTQEDISQVLLYPQVVFARTSPAQKLRIVQAAQAIGHVVAVTGDGVNDSPALKAADIGCAMGIAGTEVAKEAADMILLSDDFSAIVLGIEEGRLIFDNLKKSIAYTLSSNIPEISPFLMSIVFNMPISLTTILILCVDLGTDMIPAISLAYEKPESDIMFRPPRNALTDRLVTTQLIFFAYFQIGVFQALAGFYSFFVVLNDYGFRIGSVFGSNPSAWMPYPDNSKFEAVCPCGNGYDVSKYASYSNYPIKMYCDFELGEEGDWDYQLKENGDACAEVYEWLGDNPVEDACTIGISTEDGIVLDAAWPYGWGCPYGAARPEKMCKFDNDRKENNYKNGKETCYKATEALMYAQTAAFVSIVIVQWADLIICKTRSLSLYQQGMSNTAMLFGLFSETLLCVVLCYFEGLGYLLGTRPLKLVHWFPSMPYSVLIFLYDEVRKCLLRSQRRQLEGTGKIGFVEKYSYY